MAVTARSQALLVPPILERNALPLSVAVLPSEEVAVALEVAAELLETVRSGAFLRLTLTTFFSPKALAMVAWEMEWLHSLRLPKESSRL